MRVGPDCFLCLYRQAYRILQKFQLPEEEGVQLMGEVGGLLGKVSPNSAPPEVAGRLIYPHLSEKLGVQDLFRPEKELSTQKALSLLPLFREQIGRASDRLEVGVKLAGLGNAIDFGVMEEVDIGRELQQLEQMRFHTFHLSELRQRLGPGKSLFLIGDNVGEHLLDRLLLELLREEGVKLYYGVRGGPILNDVTRREAEEIGIGEVAEIVDTGLTLPGFHWRYATPEAAKLYFSADIVIAKGMGNYEMLGDNPGRELFTLLKVKCGRVARATGAPEGSFLFQLLKG